MKLQLWEGALDDTSLKFFHMNQKELGDRMSFTEEFAKMNARFSRDQDIGARCRWEEITLVNMGKTTAREWRDFEANFVSAWQNVEGATKEEARRLLLKKIPNFILNWVTEEEQKRSFDKPTIRINSPWDMTEQDMSDSIFVLIGKRATKVTKSRGGDFDVVLPDFGDIDKMLLFNGKTFRDTSILVKVSRIKSILDVEDIFLLVNQKLALRDRQALLKSANQQNYSEGKQGRARTVEIEPKEENPKKASGGGKSNSPPTKDTPQFPRHHRRPAHPWTRRSRKLFHLLNNCPHRLPLLLQIVVIRMVVHGLGVTNQLHGIQGDVVFRISGRILTQGGKPPLIHGMHRILGRAKTTKGRVPREVGRIRIGTIFSPRVETKARGIQIPMGRARVVVGGVVARGAGAQILGD